MSERLRQQVTQGAQRVCCSPGKDRPAWAGTNLGLRCKWSGRGVALANEQGCLDTARSHPHQSDTLTHSLSPSWTNHIGCAEANTNGSPVKDPGSSVRQK